MFVLYMCHMLPFHFYHVIFYCLLRVFITYFLLLFFYMLLWVFVFIYFISLCYIKGLSPTCYSHTLQLASYRPKLHHSPCHAELSSLAPRSPHLSLPCKVLSFHQLAPSFHRPPFSQQLYHAFMVSSH